MAASSSQRWLWGVLCSVTGSASSALGTILQKYAHVQNGRLPAGEQAATTHGLLFKSRLWVVGFLLLLIFPLPFNVAALTLADQSLITPLFGITLVLNQIFAPIFLNETLTCIDLLSSLTILVGSTITVVSANHEPDVRTLAELQGLYLRPQFLLAEGVLLAAVVVSLVFLHWETLALKSRSSDPTMDQASSSPAHTSPSGSGSGLVRSAASSLAYAFTAGAFGAQANVAMKLVGMLLFGSHTQDSSSLTTALRWPGFYACVFLMGTLATLQLCYMNEGLARFDAVTFVPEYYACLMTLGTIYGGIFYQEFQGQYYPAAKTVAFGCGCTTVLAGVLMRLLKAHFGAYTEERVDWRKTCKNFYYQRFDAGSSEQPHPTNPTSNPTTVNHHHHLGRGLFAASASEQEAMSYEQFLNDSIFCDGTTAAAAATAGAAAATSPTVGTAVTAYSASHAANPVSITHNGAAATGYVPPKYTPEPLL